VICSRTCDDNIKLDLKKECVMIWTGFIRLSRIQWQFIVNIVLNILVP
jgi:hypothetical protein